MAENMAWSCDAFVDGRWQIVLEDRGSESGAVFHSVQHMIQFYPKKTHFHVWQNGDCIFDSHEGQPEPENEV